MFQDEECCHDESNIQMPESDSSIIDLETVSICIFY